MSGARSELRALLYRVLATAYRYAERVAVIDYPHSIGRRSIDLAVTLRGGRPLLVKVALDVRGLPRGEVAELASVASSLGVPAVIAALRIQGEAMMEGVVYEKMGLPAVTPKTFEAVLSGRGGVYVYASKDTLKVKIDSEKLREERVGRNYSLGYVASYLGVSRRTIYEYERGTMDPTLEKAEKLVRLFGEEILREIDILKPPEGPGGGHPPDSSVEERLMASLSGAGLRAAHARRTAVDVTAGSEDVRVAVVVERDKEAQARLVERAEYAAELARATESVPIAVIQSKRDVVGDLESMGFEAVKSPEEAGEVVRGREGGRPRRR